MMSLPLSAAGSLRGDAKCGSLRDIREHVSIFAADRREARFAASDWIIQDPGVTLPFAGGMFGGFNLRKR
jgi:hypothetical protein